MLIRYVDLVEDLACPRTGADLTLEADGSLSAGLDHYQLSRGQPVLIATGDSVAPSFTFQGDSSGVDLSRRGHRLLRRFLGADRNCVAAKNCRTFLDMLPRGASTVLVVGGGSTGAGTASLWEASGVRLVSFDLYPSLSTTFVADAHRIPMHDNTVDGVWIQAILEHVLEPQRVADEIWRVLRDHGAVYAETPFLQPVHEGPLDITRFTESGHRYLFRRFSLVSSGTVAGPAASLRWALRAFVTAISRSAALGRAVYAGLCWLPLLDRLADSASSVDGACAVYFMGRKMDSIISPVELIDHYRGAQSDPRLRPER